MIRRMSAHQREPDRLDEPGLWVRCTCPTLPVTTALETSARKLQLGIRWVSPTSLSARSVSLGTAAAGNRRRFGTPLVATSWSASIGLGLPMLDLPPIGTRGTEAPGPLRPVIRAVINFVGGIAFRLGGRVQGRPVLRLVTTGARTGKRRIRLLGWFPDKDNADAWLVVASNGGSAHHPDWAYNLAAHPDQVMVDLGDGETPVQAEILTGSEREAGWTEISSAAPGYGRYQIKTDREIPVFRLTTRPPPATN